MTEELQAVETPVETPSTEEHTEHPTEGTDLAPDSGPDHEKKEKVVFSEDQQSVFDNAINKQTWKIKETEREAERQAGEYQARIAELQKQIPEVTEPTITATPDPFDDDYEQKIADWQTSVQVKAAYDAEQLAAKGQKQQAVYAQQVEAQNAFNAKVAGYSDNAEKVGIKPDDLKVAGSRVQQYGIRSDITEAILADPEGPLITTYLASNPQAIDALNSANIVSIGSIYADIKSKSAALKRKPSETPSPADILSGTGSPPSKHPALEGVIYT